MKECAICGEELSDHAIKCSNGHSLFKMPKDRFASSEQAKIIEKMLGKSSYNYSNSEIEYLVKHILKICIDSRQTVTEELVRRIEDNIGSKKPKIRKPERRNVFETSDTNNSSPSFLNSSRQSTASYPDIERRFPEFRGGIPKDLRSDDLITIVSDAVNTNIYNRQYLRQN
jgi:hypothetical protein